MADEMDTTALEFGPLPQPTGEDMVIPFSQAELEIGRQIPLPDLPTPSLRSRMNPEGLAPRQQMTTMENVSGAFRSGTIAGAVSEDISTRTARWADSPERKALQERSGLPGVEGAVARKALKQKDEIFQRDLPRSTDAVFEQAAYDNSQANLTPQSVVGSIIPNVLAPENFIVLPARATAAVSRFVTSRLPSATPAINRAIVAGAEGAFGNVITDPAVQAIRIGSGGQEKYEPEQTLLAPVVGFAGGAALRGGIDAATGMLRADEPGAAPTAPRADVAEAPAPAPAKIEDIAPTVEQGGIAPAAERAAGKDAIAERLRYYAQEARKVSADDGLFSDVTPVGARDLQNAAAKRGSDARPDAGQQAGLFDGGKSGAGGDVAPLRAIRDGREASPVGGQNRTQTGGLEAQPMARTTGEARVDPVFDRQLLPGQAEKPRQLPANASPEEIASFRITEAISDLAARIGRKVEVDARFTARGAAGEYKLKDGVIRLRKAGDFEVFAHEAGHAIDADLRRTLPVEWEKVIKQHEAELRPLDANTSDPAAKTVKEGIAEFLRAYVTNPEYARKKMAPNFAESFERMIQEKNPKLAEWFDAARRVADIDSGMNPVQRAEGMIVGQVEPGIFKKMRETAKREGLPIALRDIWDAFNQKVTGKDQAVYRMIELLKDARYEKTGKPMPKEYTWDDPYKRAREMPGAEQGAISQIWDGVMNYHDPSVRTGGSLHDFIALAIGRVQKIADPEDPAVRSFNGYLVMRRARALYDRFDAGDLQNRPIRMTRREVEAAIADYEARNPTFSQAAEGIFQWNRAMLDRKRDAGLLSQETIDAITSKNPTGEYVPFYRDVQDLKAGGAPGRADNLEQGAGGKAIKGSTRDILDPLQSMFLDAIRTERLIARNDFFKSMHMLAQQGGELGGRFLERIPNTELKAKSVDLAEAFRSKAREVGLEKADAEIMIREMEEMIGDDLSATLFQAVETTPKGERILFYWDGGERVALKLGNDKYSDQFFKLFSEMGAAERDLMFKAFGQANAYFTQFITNAPQFALKNILMDNISRMFIGRNAGTLGRVPFAAVAQGIYTSVFDKEFAKSYAALGGLRGGVAAAATREASTAKGFAGVAMKPSGLIAEAGDYARSFLDPAQAVKNVVTSPVDAVKLLIRAVESTETIGRVGQAKIVFKHLKKQGLSDAEAMRGALFEARDILDYDRFGEGTAIMRRLLPFTNVGIQGTSRANQNLLTDPARAVAQWNARGRDWSKVDENLKSAFVDGLLNWGVIAAGIATTAGYHAMVSDSEVYQKASDYMKKRYFLIPMPGVDENGDQNYLSIPKPFDLPGSLISAFEATLDAQKRMDPEGWKKAAAALKDGFVPRQFESPAAFLSAQPQFKTIAETVTGKTIPFDGGKPRDIVPQSLRGLPPELQYTGSTSWLGKQIGGAMGLSPLMVDHVIYSSTATAGRDVNDALTAAFDNNPNMTTQDAWTKMFFGGLYRRQRGIGSPGNAIREAMGQDGGKYVVPANGYRRFIETGDKVNADIVYNRANDIGKTVMTFRGHSFVPAERQLHPLERAESVAAITSSLTRDLAMNRVQIQDRSRKRGEQREFIQVDRNTSRALITAINAMAAEDILSGLKIVGEPGYQNAKVIDTRPRLDFIRALNSEVADELEKRIKAAHIRPIGDVEKNWPEVQRRLLQDREAARFGDLLPGVKLPRARR